MTHKITVKDFIISNENPFTLIAGNCVVESRESALETAQFLQKTCKELNINLIYKSSFTKANRTSHKSFTGLGIEDCAKIFDEIRSLGIPVVTDVHSPEDVEAIKDHVDVLQIPAFLSRQTELIMSAALTNMPMIVKQGQFAAPWDMINIFNKARSVGNTDVMFCHRGVTHGYGQLVADMTTFEHWKNVDRIVSVMDCTHATQKMGGKGDKSTGDRELAKVLARAATAVGVGALFIECHKCPEQALSDADNQIRLSDMPELLKTLKNIDNVIKGSA